MLSYSEMRRIEELMRTNPKPYMTRAESEIYKELKQYDFEHNTKKNS